MQQQQTATAEANDQVQGKVISPDPKKNSGLNSDQDTIVNEEEQNNVTNGAETGITGNENEKEKSFHKNELPDNDSPESDDGVPRIGDTPDEMEQINPKM